MQLYYTYLIATRQRKCIFQQKYHLFFILIVKRLFDFEWKLGQRFVRPPRPPPAGDTFSQINEWWSFSSKHFIFFSFSNIKNGGGTSLWPLYLTLFYCQKSTDFRKYWPNKEVSLVNKIKPIKTLFSFSFARKSKKKLKIQSLSNLV